ncbi:complex I subunit 1/NuoH family protein [Campylobacter fetus]|uniref:complex I subunit 1/NuoH family protein n=1 Tax=Campylobacter fetus TaxID=196 RepID=UPI0003C270F7|nr:complex I subunit 1 family protein [Campylobacter fetus]AGZ81062.1 NADH:quinone oxidoreductase I, membrane subunit H [Campylobacter fetus subsp. testudinum 03-427]AJB44818.1 NADH-quinone oxidoreductase subunit H [Campylobacter fetus subsp. testudinum]EAI4322798.1 NADH-quinone oxidoreductase subunit H [Campylobacter fetus]EAI4392041.1 NADH-quinone oxidoreductase subunit H [Campylobacter fetus]OCS06009.1 NADH-quinone oxidoreductase subunit H [Campylobacter fetus subsp. testudinum]
MNELVLTIFRIVFILSFILLLIPILVLLERKISAFIQDRPGPNRANIAGIRLGGIVQALADALKLAIKEDFTPASIRSKFLFTIAPMVLFLMSTLTIAVIPFSDYFTIDGVKHLMQGIPFDGGMLWYLGVASLSIYGIMLAGYASNNKYSLLGSLRAASGAISYEIPLGLAVVSMILTYGSINLNDFVVQQQGSFLGLPSWGIFVQPLAAIIFIICAFAETNRAPFDLAEGESEIVAGYHLEYSAMSFAMFFMAEYIAMTAMSALIITIFFGGYSLPYLSTADLISNYKIVLLSIVFIITVLGFIFVLWINKNNVTRYKVTNDFRKKENKFYKICTFIVVAIIDIICLYLYFTGLQSLGQEILVTILYLTIFALKTFVMLFVFIWVRWTVPRFRYDQIQRLGWEKLMPLAIFNIIITAMVVVYGN